MYDTHALAGVATYGDGLVGLWSFDSLSPNTNLTSSDQNSVIVRGTVPCQVPDSVGVTPCPPAYITGKLVASVDIADNPISDV